MQDPDRDGPSSCGRSHSSVRTQCTWEDGMSISIRRVLVYISDFDKTRLEESGSLIWRLNQRYSMAEASILPCFEYIGSSFDALDRIGRSTVDLLIVIDTPLDGPMMDLVQEVRRISPETVIFYASTTHTFPDEIPGTWDGIFRIERGGADIPPLIQIAEDTKRRSSESPSMVIAIRSEDVSFRSRAAMTAADLIWDHVCQASKDERSVQKRISIITDRPMVVLLGKGSDGMELGDRLAFLITDDGYGKNLSDQAAEVRERLGLGDLILDGEVISDLRSLEVFLKGRSELGLERDRIRTWLLARAEFELVKDLDGIAGTEELAEVIRDHRFRTKGPITDFSRECVDGDDFSRIGTGHLGGKGRGLAFLRVLLRENDLSGYKGIAVTVPRTVVLTTDIYDRFMEMNKLIPDELARQTDTRIIDLFLDSDLPSTVLGDLRDFLSKVRTPLVVRSSSLLEDALYQPFAGIYSSVMISNSGIELDKRFRALGLAIKYVYASSVLKKARAYLETTGTAPGQEKMAVVIQEVVGSWHGDLFYPAMSGVGRSFDYWPFSCCNSADGTVNLAVGLGKVIVDGGESFRFCPVHPKACMVTSVKERLDLSQKGFYALRIGGVLKSNEFSEDVQTVFEPISRAEHDGILDQIVSTYSPQNDRFYPGMGRDGVRVVDFAPILELESIPMAPLLDEILKKAHNAMGSPVEIEFAVELDPARLYLLQVRSMRGREKFGVDIDGVPHILRSGRAMGNGRYQVKDIIMVRGNELDGSNASRLVKDISMLNACLVQERRPYILIGPGRWGSCDPWLGIPVAWSDISGVKVIVERPVGARSIDPSQGSHFFHNIAALNIGYLTLSTQEDVGSNWDRLLGDIGSEDVIHRVIPHGVEVLIDGSRGIGVLSLKEG